MAVSVGQISSRALGLHTGWKGGEKIGQMRHVDIARRCQTAALARQHLRETPERFLKGDVSNQFRIHGADMLGQLAMGLMLWFTVAPAPGCTGLPRSGAEMVEKDQTRELDLVSTSERRAKPLVACTRSAFGGPASHPPAVVIQARCMF